MPPKPRFTDEATLRQGIAHGGKMLVLDGEFRFALRGRIVVVGGVFAGGPGVMVTGRRACRGIANAHAFEHTGRRMRWHLQALTAIEILTGLRAQAAPPAAQSLGQQVSRPGGMPWLSISSITV